MPHRTARLYLLLFALGTSVPALVSRAQDAAPDRTAKTAGLAADNVLIARMYDIRGLIRPVSEFPLETSPHAPAFALPGTQRDFAASANPNGRSTGLMCGPEDPPGKIPPQTRQQLLETLQTIIKNNVEPESWSDTGREGSLTEFQGQLLVTQTSANQQKIAELLRQLNQRQDCSLCTTADWLLMPLAELEKLEKPPANSRKDAGGFREIDPAAIGRLPPTVRQFHATLMSQNGQTVHYLSGRERTQTVNLTAIVGDAATEYAPVIGSIGGGVALQVDPLVDVEHHQAMVTVFSTYHDPEKPGEAITLHGVATTQPASGQPAITRLSSGTYRHINGIVQEIRTTIRLPLGVPVVVGAMTLTPTAHDADARALVLVMKVEKAD